jgi:DNA-binding GntR family transcriptional regulator
MSDFHSSPASVLDTAFAISDGKAGSTDSNLSAAVDRIRQKLLDLILSGEIAVGTRLDQRQLAKRLGTTTAPLREVFSALENEGLLVRRQGLGVFCRVYTVLEIEELVEIRGVLEALAARRATALITAAELAELKEIAARLNQPIKPDGVGEFLQCHVGFHKRVIQISRSPRLQALLEFHHFVDMVLANIAPRLWKIEPHDHLGLVSALESGNPEWAEQAMRNHIAPTYKKRFVELRARFGEGPIFSPQGV